MEFGGAEDLGLGEVGEDAGAALGVRGEQGGEDGLIPQLFQLLRVVLEYRIAQRIIIYHRRLQTMPILLQILRLYQLIPQIEKLRRIRLQLLPQFLPLHTLQPEVCIGPGIGIVDFDEVLADLQLEVLGHKGKSTRTSGWVRVVD